MIRSFRFRTGTMSALTFIVVCLLLWPSCTREHRKRGDGPISRTDDVGHVLVLDHVPRRIISLAPNITEILFELGLDSAIVGVTDYCDFPPAATLKARIGGIMNPDIERIVMLRPDLVLMTGSGNVKADFDKLTSAGLSVFVSYPRTMEDIFKSIVDVGALTSTAARADSLVANLRASRNDIVRRAASRKKQTVLMILSLNPIVAIGPGTFLDEMITLANGENIAHTSATSYPLLSREDIMRRQPDVIIATSDIIRSAADIIKSYPEWSLLSAVKNRRVGIVDASIVSRPGPRIVEGLAAVYGIIHPSQ